MKPANRTLWLLTAAVLFLTAYGSLYPLTGWRSPDGAVWAQFFRRVDRVSFGDLATNLVIYAPLGFLVVQFGRGLNPWRWIALATIAGSLLSGLMEVLQAYLPNRVSSLYDLALNACSTAIGAVLGVNLYSSTVIGRRLHELRLRHCRDDMVANLGLGVLGLWAASNLMPFVPSLDVGQIKHGLKPLWQVLNQEAPLAVADAVSYLCAVLVIATVSQRVWVPKPGRMWKTVLFVFAVLLLKGLIVSRQVTLEALLGALGGLALFRLLSRLEILAARALGLAAILLMLAVNGLQRSATVAGSLHAFNWVPFRGHLQQTLTGVLDLTGDIWPYSACAFLLIAQWRGARRVVLPLGLAAVGAFAFALEWKQQHVPDRLADITDVIVAVLAYLAPWWLLPKAGDGVRRRPSRAKTMRYGEPAGRPNRRRRRFGSLSALLALVAAAGLAGWFAVTRTTVYEPPLDESKLAQLPRGEELPAVRLPGFRSGHPRLPAPTAAEIATLEAGNRHWLERQRERARDNLQAAILSEYVSPGSIDLERLHRQLMGLEFSWRGHQQTKPLALAYDWLYDRWTSAQRAALLDKAQQGCEYQIRYIREERLSPYNVYLYNSPLQALMACALATWGDSPRADPVMRFTHDYWTRRVLPVWRQVMGAHGGWHEGGEYVGIGIGQAVYQLPAMWRAATGENYFASEPGIRGFLDYLVYRNRPDGTYLRWGDAGYFDKRAEDAKALALEYRHPAAYSLNGCPRQLAPTSWPWGPLPDDTLCDRTAETRLPLSRLFDGLGLLVARSDWTRDATHVSFKAGDNFWSHSHLDQGAFTIFKRFPLAIDSGVYGTKYGSDHHMNYTYQTIAHNAILVTDPNDIVQAPGKNDSRYFANDGGQRRIGSGWGVTAAPLDQDEWLSARETYHTGEILAYTQTAVLDSLVTNLTPAYTNALSGKGLFSSRTLRVSDYRRSFAYDHEMDVVLVYDRVSLAKPEFYVRWLLHTVARPAKRRDGVDLVMEPSALDPHAGPAGMRVYMPLPIDRNLSVVGGPGAEFEVDGRNYDDSGAVQRMKLQKKLDEAGDWRVELGAAAHDYRHEFLVLLVPWVDAPPEDLAVDCAATGTTHLCRVSRDGRQVQYSVHRETGEIRR